MHVLRNFRVFRPWFNDTLNNACWPQHQRYGVLLGDLKCSLRVMQPLWNVWMWSAIIRFGSWFLGLLLCLEQLAYYSSIWLKFCPHVFLFLDRSSANVRKPDLDLTCHDDVVPCHVRHESVSNTFIFSFLSFISPKITCCIGYIKCFGFSWLHFKAAALKD